MTHKDHTDDEPVNVGELQVWEVSNTSLMDHPFHLVTGALNTLIIISTAIAGIGVEANCIQINLLSCPPVKPINKDSRTLKLKVIAINVINSFFVSLLVMSIQMVRSKMTANVRYLQWQDIL